MKPSAGHPFLWSSHPVPSKWRITEKKWQKIFFLRNNTRKITYFFFFLISIPTITITCSSDDSNKDLSYDISVGRKQNYCLLNLKIHELTNRFSRITTGKINLKSKIFTLLGCYTGWLVFSYWFFRTPYHSHLVGLSDPWKWDQQAVPSCR
jgi:hypothetical protein